MNDNIKQEIRMNKDKNKNQNVKIRSGIKAGPITGAGTNPMITYPMITFG